MQGEQQHQPPTTNSSIAALAVEDRPLFERARHLQFILKFDHLTEAEFQQVTTELETIILRFLSADLEAVEQLPSASGTLQVSSQNIYFRGDLTDTRVRLFRVFGPGGYMAKAIEKATGCKLALAGRLNRGLQVPQKMWRAPGIERQLDILHIKVSCSDAPEIANDKVATAVRNVRRLLTLPELGHIDAIQHKLNLTKSLIDPLNQCDDMSQLLYLHGIPDA